MLFANFLINKIYRFLCESDLHLINYITIYAYMRNTNASNELMTRKRVVIELVYKPKEDNQLNLANINMWLDKLNSLINISLFDTIFQLNPNVGEKNYNIKMCDQSIKPFLVFINEKTIRSEKKVYTDIVMSVWSVDNPKEKMRFNKQGIFFSSWVCSESI